MAKDETTAKALFIALAVSGAAIVIGGQYVSCDSFICDWLGAISGWIKNMIGKAQNSISGAAGAEPDAMDIAVNMICGFEGFRSHAYNDQVGILTIGYGHKIVPGDGFDSNSSISESDARNLVYDDASGAQSCVRSACGVPLSPQQEAALISLCYNIGCGNFNSSTLVKLLNQGDYTGASNEFSRWVYAGGQQLPGLISRRESEAQVFTAGTGVANG